ncbi:hypothetical protein PENTCL1PPCAC_2935 [Pristionchus entomophagus]|uniref:F-box domain-containing protein n=1 Tax=Pristionchus entomophagus TaxID=358040 RepID=A0AAV5SKU7_9BILA|nr:hypothetical protein PENTCL1PPCAC_2935 [Pristionchus entomophagus]
MAFSSLAHFSIAGTFKKKMSDGAAESDNETQDAKIVQIIVDEVMDVVTSSEKDDILKEDSTDYFSVLPFDCKLAIFAHLDRNSLDLMECASKKLHAMAIHRSLKNIKLQKQELIFGQSRVEKCHLFHLVSMNDESKRIACTVKEDGENEFTTKIFCYQKPKVNRFRQMSIAFNM